MQKHTKARQQLAQPTPPVHTKELTDLERTINGLLMLGEDKEDLHRFLDDFFLSWLLENTNVEVERGDIAEHFYCYTYLQRIIRHAQETTSSTSKSLAV